MAIVTIDSKVLANTLRAMLLAASTDETRAALSCIRIETRGKDLRMVATDGHWLLAVDRTMADDAILGTDDIVHISREDATRLIKCLPKKGVVRVNLAGRVDDINGREQQIGAFVVADVTFPPYEQVIPDCTSIEHPRPATWMTSAILERVTKAASLLAADKHGDAGIHIAYGAGELDPCLATFGEKYDVRALAVIMPRKMHAPELGALVARFKESTPAKKETAAAAE